MQSPKDKALVRWASLGLPLTLSGALLAAASGGGLEGCSSSSNGGPADAAADVAVPYEGGPPALGVPIANCNGCDGTLTCGGVLAGPEAGITYCTEQCGEAGEVCPTGLTCVPNVLTPALYDECLVGCSKDTDCQAPFICRSDVAPVSVCWSPYPPPSDAGSTPDAGTDGGDAGTPESDAGEPDASDAGSTTTDAGDAGLGADADSGT
jgi:hypothetical protein